MATSGELTKGGLLYEGNHTEWRSRIDSLLKVQGVDIDKISQPAYRDWHGLAERQKAVKLIMDQVSPALLGRITAADARDPKTLLISLQAVAKPFRLNDLPPELRVKVYESAFLYRFVCVLEGKSRFWRTYQSGAPAGPVLPDLLHTSRLISAEALPVFFSKLRPIFDCVVDDDLSRSQNGEPSGLCTVRQWAHKSLEGNVKHIRLIGLVGLYNDRHRLIVMLKDRIGLITRFSNEFPVEKKAAWEKHVANTETNRKALGLQGEALVLCFTSRPELWH
ncbi:hypothetical protein LTR15_006214 [Elasticomyces elasticus]|nr:hypothetical protein LTR15_006214 [Elasticomyces elasticus]